MKCLAILSFFITIPKSINITVILRIVTIEKSELAFLP